MLVPNSWGSSGEGSGGRRGAHPLSASIRRDEHPQQGRNWQREGSPPWGCCFPSTQALAPRPEPHAPETVLPLPAQTLVP